MKGDGVKCNSELISHTMLQENLDECHLCISIAYGASIEIVDPP